MLGDEVGTGQPELDEAVGDVLGDVLGADEQELDVGIADGRAQASLGELELEPGVAQQLDRRLGKPTLVREPRDAAAVVIGGASVSAPAGRAPADSRRARTGATG